MVNHEVTEQNSQKGLKDADWLLWTFSSQNPEAKACLDVPLQKDINVFGVRLCGCIVIGSESCDMLN